MERQYRRDWVVVRHSIEHLATVEIEGERRYGGTLGWTAAWYAMPCALYVTWLLLMDGKPGTACARAVGRSCPTGRVTAVHDLWHGVPRIAVALCLSLGIALLLRRGSAAWRPLASAFAAAVIGAGTATILFSVL